MVYVCLAHQRASSVPCGEMLCESKDGSFAHQKLTQDLICCDVHHVRGPTSPSSSFYCFHSLGSSSKNERNLYRQKGVQTFTGPLHFLPTLSLSLFRCKQARRNSGSDGALSSSPNQLGADRLGSWW